MRKSRLNYSKQEKLIAYFVSGTTADCASILLGINKSSGAYYFHRLREITAIEVENESREVFCGEIEVDESYFVVGVRKKGTRCRRKDSGLWSSKARWACVCEDYSRCIFRLIPIIERKVLPESIVYFDCWRGYNVLDVSEFKHYRINHSE